MWLLMYIAASGDDVVLRNAAHGTVTVVARCGFILLTVYRIIHIMTQPFQNVLIATRLVVAMVPN